MIVTHTKQFCIKPSKTLLWPYHVLKNLYNECNYQISLEVFNDGCWIRYRCLYHFIKTSNNHQKLLAQTGQQILKNLDRNLRSFKFNNLSESSNDKQTYSILVKVAEYL